MASLLRIVTVFILAISLSLATGCAKQEDAKPKTTQKKVSKKAKKTKPANSDSGTEEPESGTISFPNLVGKSSKSSTDMPEERPSAPPVTQKVPEQPATAKTSEPEETIRPATRLGNVSITDEAGPEQEKFIKSFEDHARKRRPADAAKVNVLTVDEYEAQFKNDLKLHEKFKDQFIEVSGIVRSFWLNGVNERFLYLAPEDKPFDYDMVPYFTFDREPWGKLAAGQKVKLRAWYLDHPGWIFEIVEKGESTAVNLTADEVVAEFTADRSKAREKYFGKGFVITGKLKQIRKQGQHLGSVIFETTGKLQVSCSAPDTPNYVTEKLEVGKPLKVYGELTLVDDNEMIFAPGFIISPEREGPAKTTPKP